MTDAPADPADATDGVLLARYADHADESAFAEVARRHQRLVLGVCQRVLGNGADADDAAQAVLLTLARRASRLRHERCVGAWLHHVARAVARNARASAATRARHEREAAFRPAAPETDVAALRESLDHELARLPERYRAPLILFHLEERSLADTARALGRPVGTVGVQLDRARDLLRSRLERAGLVARGAALAPALALLAPPPAMSAPVIATASASPAATVLADGAVRMLQLAALKTALAASLAVGGMLGLGGLAVAAAADPPAATAAIETEADLRRRIAELEQRNRELERMVRLTRETSALVHARFAMVEDRLAGSVGIDELVRSGLLGPTPSEGRSFLWTDDGRISATAATLLRLGPESQAEVEAAVDEAITSLAAALGPIPTEVDAVTRTVTLRLPAIPADGQAVRARLHERLAATMGADRADLLLAIAASRFHDDPFLGFGTQAQQLVISPNGERLEVRHHVGNNPWKWGNTFDQLPAKYRLVRQAHEDALAGTTPPTTPDRGF